MVMLMLMMLMMLMKMTYLYSICHNLCVKHEFVFRKQLPMRTVEYFDPSSTHNLCLYLKIINRIKFHCCHHSNAHLFFFFLRLGYNYIYICAFLPPPLKGGRRHQGVSPFINIQCVYIYIYDVCVCATCSEVKTRIVLSLFFSSI